MGVERLFPDVRYECIDRDSELPVQGNDSGKERNVGMFFVTEHFLPDVGGMERSIAYLGAELSRRRNLEVITLDAATDFVDEFPFSVKRFERSEHPPYDAMFDHMLAMSSSRQPVCFFGFSHVWPEQHLRFVRRVKEEVATRVTFKVPSLHEFSRYVDSAARRRLFDYVDYVLCLNEGIAEELELAGVEESRVIPITNGIPLDFYRPCGDDDRDRLREVIGVSRESTVFVFAGRFAGRKRIDLLVDVFREVPDVVLLLVGFFDDRFDAGAQYSVVDRERIRVFDPVFDVRPFLHAADYFVSASASEGMPNAVLEALACGLPAVVTSIPGHSNVIDPFVNGVLFESDSRAGLRGAVQWCLDHRDDLPQMRIAARDSAVARFGIARVADKYMELL
jgi:glycosyltransferase involved in cell wall biosynthesis